MEIKPGNEQALKRRRLTAAACGVFLASMLGVSYAAVPLYNLFCKVTGYGGTTQIAQTGADRILDRKITIRFDANVAGGLAWSFKPTERSMVLQIGETGQATYRFSNTGAAPSVGTSTFNVTPQSAGAYFNKLECFCFTEQALAAGESVELPVVFFIDPAMVEDKDLEHVNTITLSYTFFPAAGGTAPVAKVKQPVSEKTPEKL
uniref:cytochrome c oxidase assembly protein n=1 Tax=Pararhizobium sp. IMCC3301 TaxID=3067904 RepID=UPI002740E09E|nr:cytochrome c oxidase assembly protein [Pararhizobium sp. IMCC3301]